MENLSFNEYLQKPIEERITIVNTKITARSPLWLERLHTAITQFNPLSVSFNHLLMDEYYKLISNKK